VVGFTPLYVKYIIERKKMTKRKNKKKRDKAKRKTEIDFSENRYDFDESSDEEVELNSELAKEFDVLCKDVHKKIRAKLDEASKALDEASAIADQYDVPFYTGVSPLDNSYIPTNFSKSKFKNLDVVDVIRISGAYNVHYIEEMSGGWVHSTSC
jgi:hypothetical protein